MDGKYLKPKFKVEKLSFVTQMAQWVGDHTWLLLVGRSNPREYMENHAPIFPVLKGKV